MTMFATTYRSARTRRGSSLLAALCWLALAIAASPAVAAPGARVALVIGNGGYTAVGRLANPGNDARLVATSLKAAGFTLIGGEAQVDLDKQRFDRRVAEFGRAIVGADVALFYYSGHGLQVDGINFLVPVDANPSRRQDLDFQMVNADLVLRQMSGSGTKLNLIILDACRNNPFEGTGLRSAGGGLAEMKAPEGTLISYATQPGAVAHDGVGRDSPFTIALVDAMRQPGLDIFRLFNRVGLEVKKDTSGEQQPWLSASPIEGDFAFTPAAAPPPVPAPAPVAAAPAAPTVSAPETSADAKSTGAVAGKPSSGRPAGETQTAALMPPATLPPQVVQPKPPVPEAPTTGFHCPAKDVFVFGKNELVDWSGGDAASVRRVTGAWSWRSLGPDPADPNMCLRTANGGVGHRLFGWFDMDKLQFPSDPEAPTLALLRGQSGDMTISYKLHGVSFDVRYHFRGHESFVIGTRAYDTMVFDVAEASSHNPHNGLGRVWYAPTLGVFVRRIWHAAASSDVVGFEVVDVTTDGSRATAVSAEGGQ